MNPVATGAKALFIAPNGNIYPDSLICSGILPAQLQGKPCPFSQDAHLPTPLPLNENDPHYSIDQGRAGELCPPCARQQLSSLGHWQGHGGQTFADELLPLRLFKCHQWLWLVVPGLYHDDPTIIKEEERK
jgi:hypothetical protein